MKKWTITLVALLVLFLPVTKTNAAEKPLSSGVSLNQYAHKGNYSNNINHIKINLSDSFTKVDIGLPSSYAGRATTTAIANRDSIEGNRVVGAINASFFHMNNGFPIYLISKNNEIYNGGIISDSQDAYVSKPIAFGITENGLAEIDTFNLNISLTHSGKNYVVSGINRVRDVNESILFTPQHHSSATNSNQYGVQYVVETENPITSTYFGQTLTGNVTKIVPYGSSETVTIPKNGFVISANQNKATEISNISVGDEVSVRISIDEKWQNSEFMLASGPMLVQDGKRYITMSTSSSRATERTARSAVAISKDKTQVHLVTVDGKQSNSPGMTLVEFANFLVSQGFDRAINLDGGGSTTMAYRNYGSNNVVLANTPAYGSQRAISTIVEAISTAPTSEAEKIKYSRSNVGTLLAGTGSKVTVDYILDKYYNPITIDSSKLQLVSEGKKVKINDMIIVSTGAANDRVLIKYDGKVLDSFPLKVVDAPTTMSISGNKEVGLKSTTSYIVNAKDADGNPLIFNTSMAQWSVEGDIGTITKEGEFTPSKAGSGNIVAKLGTKTVKYPIQVMGGFSDVPVTHSYFKQINYLVDNKYISGYEDGTFKPNNEITRAHSALIISKVLGLDTTNVVDPKFKDIPTTHIYYKQIAAVQNAGIMSGKEGNVFDPNGKLTRAQMAVIIANAFELSGKSSKQFSDVGSTHWAHPYVQALAANNITSGYTDGTFKPNTNIIRSHFGLFVYNALHK